MAGAGGPKDVRYFLRAGSSPRRRPRLPPPTLCSHYTASGENYKGASAEGSRRRTEGWRRKNSASAEYLSRASAGRLKIFFSKKSQCRKLSHSAENTLFHILIHCGNHSLYIAPSQHIAVLS